ncbi:hypothetical protein K439DRAFT_1657317 [Ramaria rubella]|nr:hypothetical protein K439DRAFT_1657317 [Ramaria rubella]
MGSLSSKVGRALPTKARPSGTGGALGSAHPSSKPLPIAKEARDQAIETDGKDPHLLANLSRINIGQIDVGSPRATAQKTHQTSEIYRRRHLSEQQAASARPVRNRLAASTLSSLLDDRKFVTSRSDLELLAAGYTVDVAVLESLTKFVNSPSVGEGTVVRTVSEDGQERITMQAVWSEPMVLVSERTDP